MSSKKNVKMLAVRVGAAILAGLMVFGACFVTIQFLFM